MFVAQSSEQYAKEDAESKIRYQQLMRVLMGASLGSAVLSLLILGWSGGGGYVTLVLLICVGAFALSDWLMASIFKTRHDDHDMRRIAAAIKEGAESFLRVQYSSIAWMALVVAGSLFFIYLFRSVPDAVLPVVSDASSSSSSPSSSSSSSPSSATEVVSAGHMSRFSIALLVAVSFVLGSVCSALTGYMGVWVSVRVNVRVGIAAARQRYSQALLICFRGGAVSALLSASLCILGLCLLYLVCHVVCVMIVAVPSAQIPPLMAGYGFGASFVALFMQLGGGIYTKGADVGADMCGKIEQSIPEDDPRNPAVVADLVGDNVGDCAGSMADVFESIAAEVIGTMILGSTLANEMLRDQDQAADKEADEEGLWASFVFFPLVIHAFDLVVSGLGIVLMRARSETEDPLTSMRRAYAVSMGVAAVLFAATCRTMLYTDLAPSAWWHFALCGGVGIVTSWALIWITQYYTDYNHAPVQRIAAASMTGHGTNVISGLSVGLESTALPVAVIAAALLVSYGLGSNSGLPGQASGVFGCAVATMGMLCTAVYVLAMNNFGPIADNAGGVVEMSGQAEEARRITDRLDAVGNVTKAASKGYAVGGSALACFVLFQAYLDEVAMHMPNGIFNSINVASVEMVVAGMVGVAMIFLFTGWSMSAVGRTAEQVVWEVRRQFKERPGLLAGHQRPDYAKCVAIVTKAALKEMARPALLALLTPVCVGFLFRLIGDESGRGSLGVEAVGTFMLFSSLTGLIMAIFLDNAYGMGPGCRLDCCDAVVLG